MENNKITPEEAFLLAIYLFNGKNTLKTTAECIEKTGSIDNYIDDIKEQLITVRKAIEAAKQPVIPTWEEAIKKINYCYYINNSAELINIGQISTALENRNLFHTAKQAQSALAKAQLSVIMAAMGDVCSGVDWSDQRQVKYTISREGNNIKLICFRVAYKFLAFTDKQIAEQFLQKHESLIKQYYEL